MEFDLKWDNDGYPVDAHLASRNNRFILQDKRVAWEWLKRNLELCSQNTSASYELVNATDIIDRPTQHIHFSTGGWSGAETLVDIIEGHFWASNLILRWRRGGHYIFESPAPTDKGDE